MTIYATRTDGPTYATRTDGPTYAKIIGNNYGQYPYRVGLNTLAHNGERFDPRPECGSGGLYYCDIKGIFEWLAYGDKLCIVEPVGRVVAVEDKFKTDKLEIVSMMSLLDNDTWKFLVERGADVHAGDNNALRWAALGGRIEVLKFLVEHGADIHVYDEYALRWAAESGHLEVVKFLVESGADVHALNDAAMRLAAMNGHHDVVAYLKNC